MEIWIVYALASMVLSGVYVFVQKVFAEHGYKIGEAIYLINIGQVLGGFVGWGLTGFSLLDWKVMLIIASINGAVYILVDFFRMRSLSYIDTALFFPIHKAAGPALVTLAGVFLFREHLSGVELLGIMLGILVPLMLLHKSEHIRQKDLSRGVMYLFGAVVGSSIGAVMTKLAADNQASAFLYVFSSSVIATILMLLFRRVKKSKIVDPEESKCDKKKLFQFISVTLGIVNTVTLFFMIKAAEFSLSISYTINSFYILIPIILSVIFYREHMNARKAIAIILSLAAITFFQM